MPYKQLRRPAALSFLLISALISFSSASLAEVKHIPQKKIIPERPVTYIGILPQLSPDKTWTLYKPFIDYLNRSTDLHWELKLSNDHGHIIESICNGDISIAFLGPVHFAIAYKKCGIKPLVVALSEDGDVYFRAAIITGDQSINSVKELKGRSFAFGPKQTAGAYVIPRKMLEEEGITMEMISPVFYTGGDRIIDAVIRREAEAGAVREGLVKIVKHSNLKVLKLSEPIMNLAFSASPMLRHDTGRKFADALIRLRPLINKADSNAVKGWHLELRYGFAKPPDNYIHESLELYKTYEQYNQ